MVCRMVCRVVGLMVVMLMVVQLARARTHEETVGGRWGWWWWGWVPHIIGDLGVREQVDESFGTGARDSHVERSLEEVARLAQRAWRRVGVRGAG
jgi:hypothetical protein